MRLQVRAKGAKKERIRVDPIVRFISYSAAFEEFVENDDPSILRPYFTEDAVYEVVASLPFGGRHEGWDAVLAAFRGSLDNNDRRFDSRKLEVLEGPLSRRGAIWTRWRATYSLEGAPDMVIDGEEIAHFRGDRMSRLEDRFTETSQLAALAYFDAYEARLNPVRDRQRP